MRSPFQPASAPSILARILASPPLMRADHLAAWVRDLAGDRAPLEVHRTSRAQVQLETAQEQDLPWDAPLYEIANGIAVINVTGPLVKGCDASTCWFYGLMSTDRLQDAIVELEAQPDVRIVIFKFNSPGGMAQGIPETAAALGDLSNSKLTIGFTDTLCCSAAYWLASQCSHLFSTMSADIGSIGTYLAFYDFTGMLEKEGIRLELFARGTYKALGLPGNPLTAEQRSFLEAEVTRVNDRFLAAVRAARPGVSDATMQGQWFDGEQALAAGLIDDVVPNYHSVLGALLTPSI